MRELVPACPPVAWRSIIKVRKPSEAGAARLGELRAFVERFPRQAALKRLLGRQGVPVREDVRAPLRGLTADERDELDRWQDSLASA